MNISFNVILFTFISSTTQMIIYPQWFIRKAFLYQQIFALFVAGGALVSEVFRTNMDHERHTDLYLLKLYKYLTFEA